MKLLMFRNKGKEFMLFTDSSYTWDSLQQKYPDIKDGSWTIDRFVDVDSADLPVDFLIEVCRPVSQQPISEPVPPPAVPIPDIIKKGIKKAEEVLKEEPTIIEPVIEPINTKSIEDVLGLKPVEVDDSKDPAVITKEEIQVAKDKNNKPKGKK